MDVTKDPSDSASQQPPKDAESANGDIEEGIAAYQPGGFHPVYIGDVYHDRYTVLSKIGYGVYSTVWLVQDTQGRKGDSREFLALKVLSAEWCGTENRIFEREILQHLRDGNPKQFGYEQICHLVDDFEHSGPNGTHVCLVFELIGETLNSFQCWFPNDRLPNSVMRRFTIQLLLALDYAHDRGVIHTDIQPRNIFIKIKDYTQIESGYLTNAPITQQDRDEGSYTILQSRPLRQYYFTGEEKISEFDIVLGDWGVASWVDKHLSENIQPIALRAPEVLIKAPWDTTTDLWNLGAMLLEMFCAVRMFSGQVGPDGHYEVTQHLAEIVHLFGPFPKALLEKANQDIVGPIFGDDGRLRDSPQLDKPALLSAVFTPGLDPEIREQFVSFLYALMKINPTERPTPEDLLRLPWLDAL